MASQLRLAYITTHYPALSHTFIRREVAALRGLGAEVHTISLRRTSGEHLLSRENRLAAQSTYSVLPARPGHVLASHLIALARHPRAYLAALWEACRLSQPGLRARVWQLFYFAEAILVWRHCAAAGVRHIHAHHGSAPADVALLAARFGSGACEGPRTWSLTLHGPDELRDIERFSLAEKVRRADAVVCISEFARSQVMALLEPDQWGKLRIVHCGVTPSRYPHVADPQHERARVLSVGRLVPQKGHAVLLNAIAALARDGHDTEAVLVGSGPMRPTLERLADELGIAERVTFRGALGSDEVARCYAEASLFCCASFAEGLPVVLMEAMASGRAVVATSIAGVGELVRDGETGLLVTPGSAEELAAAIAELLDDPGLRTRLARAGRQAVRRDFDVARSAEALAELFAQLTGSSWQRPERRVEPDSEPRSQPYTVAGAARAPHAAVRAREQEPEAVLR